MQASSNNSQLIELFYSKLINARDEESALTGVKEVLAEDWTIYPTGPMDATPEKWVSKIMKFRQTVPDLRWEILQILFGTDGYYTVIGKVHGTPVGTFMGIETDGTKSFEINSIDIHKVENEKIVESRHIEDWFTAVAQLSQ